MPATQSDINELDLHWTDEDPVLGIASEGVHCKNMDEISRRIAEVKDTVKKINLQNQHALTGIPSILKECKLLEELDITHTEIAAIPDFLLALPNLRVLSCCCRKLSHPPSGFAAAKKLEKLHMRLNEDWSFPEGITALHELKTLSLDFYSVIPLSKDMGALKKLENLTLILKYEEGDAPGLSASFAGHPSLKRFEIANHIPKNHKAFDLANAAQILSGCPAFKSLVLSGVAVGKGHQALSTLAGLQELELRHLLVEGNIFDSIASLKNLEKLDLWGSEFKLTELPDVFANFKEMQTFSFAGNFVKTLPPSLFSLDKLTTLEIGSTGISALDEKTGSLENLERIHVYDNMLETLPETIFTLPRLAVLDIQENFFKPKDIAAIKEKLATLNSQGRTIELRDEGQGHRQMLKRLRNLEDIAAMDPAVYYKHCLEAVIEDAHSIKYADKNKLHGNYYAALCMTAVKKSCFALDEVDPKMMDSGMYFRVCLEAAKNPDIGHAFKFINDELLSEYEYIQICLEAALHNIYADFLNCIDVKRLNRNDYERICWAAILHHPSVIYYMIEPTDELRQLAASLYKKHEHESK